MKKYEVEARKEYDDLFFDPYGDYTEAESKFEAVDLVKQWMIDHGEDPEVVGNMVFIAREIREWYDDPDEWEYFI